MRRPPSFDRPPVQFNMTPMIDVVFLLIVFFLVSSHLARQETQMQLPLPLAESGETPEGTQTPRLTINVLRDGEFLLAGRTVRPLELQERLRQKLDDVGERLEVRIRSDRQVPYERVEPILLACARAGIWNVSFAVYRPEEAL